jgi:hypothetical protein
MNRHIFRASAVLAVACAAAAGGVQAHDRTQWSVTAGNQPRGVVIVPQTQFSYGAPPSVYTPPPPVYGHPPTVVAPPPVFYVQPPPVYVNPHQQRHGWHDRRDWDRHDRHGWQDRHDRRDWQDRRDWNDGRQRQWERGPGQGYGQYRR